MISYFQLQERTYYITAHFSESTNLILFTAQNTKDENNLQRFKKSFKDLILQNEM